MSDEHKFQVQYLEIQQRWDEEVHQVWFEGQVYFNIIHFLAMLGVSADPADYWSTIKRRLTTEGFQATQQQIRQFPVKSPSDQRTRKRDYATRETLLRLVQSLSSPIVEPMKLYLARLGEEHLQEVKAEQISEKIEAACKEYRDKGRSEEWIRLRRDNIMARNALTDEWDKRGPLDFTKYGLFTAILHRGALGVTPSLHTTIKNLPSKENVRDHMDHVELALLTLAEVTATAKHQENQSFGEQALRDDVEETAEGSTQIRLITEQSLGRSVVSSTNYLPPERKRKKKVVSPRSSKKKQIQASDSPTLF